MKFKTIEDYDEYLNEIKQDLDEIDEYLKEHPESIGTKGNYETIKYVYDIYKNNRCKFIQKLNEINLKLEGKTLNKPLSLNNMYSLSLKFNTAKNSTINLIDMNFTTPEDLLIEKISKGSYNITFSFPNPTEEDVKRTSSRKKGLMKIFDFINCGENIEKLKKEAGPNGNEALINYKEFICEIIKNNADFTLDTEMGTLKCSLTLQQCKNICENLNV
ncbi:hypothetical protein [Methanobrevibacter sp.]|uniref:hypothetical protein n=1 Tax=Methanobrevibacter sp. TaxID=66852 RepID=UPI00388FF9E1